MLREVSTLNLGVDGCYNPSIGKTNGIEIFYNVSMDIGGYYMVNLHACNERVPKYIKSAS